jgi:AcrR family transcriptional regulator
LLTSPRSPEYAARLVAATRELLVDTGGTDFTVQQVVARAGLSLKTCYRNFASKDELLIATLEAASQEGADLFRQLADAEATPIDRLRAFVLGLCASAEGPWAREATAVAREHLRLTKEHAGATQSALEPIVAVLVELVQDAMDAGAVRPGSARRDATTIFNLCLAHIHAVALGIGAPDAEVGATPEYVWEFCRAALAPV